MRNNLLIALALAGALAGCAPTVWDKPGATQADFGQDSARCRLVARGMNSGDFYAQGSANFVAGATLGNAVGTAIGAAATYRDCMMAIGYTPQASGAANSSVASTVPADEGHCGGDIHSPETNCKGQ